MKVTIYLDNGHLITVPDCADSVPDMISREIAGASNCVISFNGGIYVNSSKINYFEVEK